MGDTTGTMGELPGATAGGTRIVPIDATLGDPAAHAECLRLAKLNGDRAVAIVAERKALHEVGPYDAARDAELADALSRCVEEERIRRGSVRALLAMDAWCAWLLARVRFVPAEGA